jgi:hypothetical protein
LVDKLKNPFSFYLATFILILYTWRLVPFGSFFNIFLILSIILGLKNNNFTKILKTRKIPPYFFYIIIGIIISIIYNTIQIGSFAEVFQNNQNYTSLKFKSIFEGIGLFLILLININSKIALRKFYILFTISGVFLVIFWLVGFTGFLINLFGIETYLESNDIIRSSYSPIRLSFETLDENTFGSICCLLFLFCNHLTFYSKNKAFYFIFSIILLYAIELTVSRTVSARLVLQTFVYLILSGVFPRKTFFVIFIISFPILILTFMYNPFVDITFRFSETYNNILIWQDTGILLSRDSFQYRLVRSLLGVPDTISGWIFGSGGKQTAKFFKSTDHIEYTNWLWQYGLVTFIPLMLFLITTIKRSLNIRSTKLSRQNQSIMAVNVAIIIGMMTSMIGNPQFYYLWITLSITSLIMYYYNEKKPIT